MNANSFFSVQYDMPHSVNMRRVQHMLCSGPGDRMEVVGRWVTLLAMLYDADGVIDMGRDMPILLESLDTDEAGLAAFLEACASVDWLDAEALERGKVISHGVADELAYRRQKADAGRKSGEARRGKSAGAKKRTKQ